MGAGLCFEHIGRAIYDSDIGNDNSLSCRILRLAEYAAEQQQRAEDAEDRLAEMCRQNQLSGQ